MAKKAIEVDPLAGLSSTARKLYPALRQMKIRINSLPVADARIHLSREYTAALRNGLNISQSSNLHKAVRELEAYGLVELERRKNKGAYLKVF